MSSSPEVVDEGASAAGQLVVVATANHGKLAEIRSALPFVGWRFVPASELDYEWPSPEETGTTFEEKYGEPVRQDIGIYMDTPAQTGVTRFIPLDLEDGRKAAEVAVWVREWQKRSDQLGEPLDREELLHAAALNPTREEIALAQAILDQRGEM